jgi:hypothetical protein
MAMEMLMFQIYCALFPTGAVRDVKISMAIQSSTLRICFTYWIRGVIVRCMEVPEDIDVIVVENSDTTVHITLPAAPGNHNELSDEELAKAAGGTIKSQRE